MNETRKSDDLVVPRKPSNKADTGTGKGTTSVAERVEGRGSTKGNPGQQTRHRTQSRERLQQALGRIRQAARRDRKQRFTALWHHVYDPGRLESVYRQLNRRGAAGVDEMTWEVYGEELEARLEDLSGRLARGAYRAKPVRRVYIPKGDGRQRPLGVPALEDKIVQRATTEVLNAIFEPDFKGFSYGFRPGRSQHDALDALAVGLTRRKVSWVLDADIGGFFDAISHEWLIRFVEHRIGDQRVVRHIKKWLEAGVLEDGKVWRVEQGTPQGGSISPLLANIYLHHVFDLWIDHWRKSADGDVIVVRYADDFVIGFQHEREAERCLNELRERLARFELELHPEKTRLIEFGRYAMQNRKGRGEGKPGTFDFLGFTHVCGRTRKGRYKVQRIPMATRRRSKLAALKRELRRRMHHPVREVGRWLQTVLTGYYQYYAVPGSSHWLSAMRHQVARLWYRTLRRRSHKTRMNWRRMTKLTDRWLPRPRILHPYPDQRLRVTT